MENIETAEEGITFGEIVRRIGKRIWIVLGASVLVTLAAALLMYFWINPAMATYSMEFVIVYPTDVAAYPDGGPFFYQDIVSHAFLSEARESDEGFAHIKVDNMSLRDDISVWAEAAETGGVKRETGRYTVRVKAGYFNGKEEAERFIRALAATFGNRMKSAADKVDFATDEAIFASAPFGEQLALLESDRDAILEKYDEWMACYSSEFRVVPIGEDGTEGKGMQLKDFRAQVIALCGENAQEELKSELALGGYYKGEDVADYAARLRMEYRSNEREIEALGTYAQATMSVQEASDLTPAQRIATLITRNNNIRTWLGESYLEGSAAYDFEHNSEGTLNRANVEAFSSRVAAERAKIEQAAETLTAVTRGIYSGEMVRFDSHVSADGGTSLALVSVAAFLLAFVAASAIVCSIERSRSKKAEKAETDTDSGSEA